ncbi:hypothetical protein, partial [Burkholderia pseudomallei]
NRLFFMTSFSPLEAILSSFNWSENSRAGQMGAARRIWIGGNGRLAGDLAILWPRVSLDTWRRSCNTV